MIFNYFICTATLFLLLCARQEKSNSDLTQKDEYERTEQNQQAQYKRFTNIQGIDSIATFDKSIIETDIDSTTILPMSFDAKYIGCFKTNLNRNLYRTLKSTAPEKYTQIMAITTDHEIVKSETTYYFHGLKNVDCDFPESSEVRIESTIYSFYSDLRLLGRVLIIDKIIKKPDSHR